MQVATFIQETFFSIKISEFFLTSQTSLKKSLVHLESFWKELKLQKSLCVCCKTSAAGNKMLCHCNFPSDVGLLLSKRSFWCTLELTSETLLSAPRKLTHFCLENSTSQTLKVQKYILKMDGVFTQFVREDFGFEIPKQMMNFEFLT